MKPAGNLGFGNADTMEPPDLRGLQSSRYRPTQPLAVLPGVGPASPGSLPQNLPFEFGEYSQQTGHGSTGRCSEVQRLGQRNDPDVEMFQFLKSCQQVCDRPAPAVQSPYEHYIDVPATRSLQDSLAGFSFCRTRANFPDLQGNGPATPGGILTHGAALHR